MPIDDCSFNNKFKNCFQEQKLFYKIGIYNNKKIINSLYDWSL